MFVAIAARDRITASSAMANTRIDDQYLEGVAGY
jgi:hypothetical protein